MKKVQALGYLDVAVRIQQYITAILRHAVQQKLIRHNPAYDMEGAVQKPQIPEHYQKMLSTGVVTFCFLWP